MDGSKIFIPVIYHKRLNNGPPILHEGTLCIFEINA